MRTYGAPRQSRRVPPLAWDLPGPPRAFREWAALRRWNKLPDGETRVIGYLCRLAREEAGLTQRDLAKRLLTTQQSVAQAERWAANPTGDFLRKWAMACGHALRIEFEELPAEGDTRRPRRKVTG